MLRLGAPPAATSMALGRRSNARLEHLARARAARHRTVVNDQLQCEDASTRSAVVQAAAVAEQPPAPAPLAAQAHGEGVHHQISISSAAFLRKGLVPVVAVRFGVLPVLSMT